MEPALYLCFVFGSQSRQRLLLYTLLTNWYCATEMECVYCAVRTEFLHKTDMFHSESKSGKWKEKPTCLLLKIIFKVYVSNNYEENRRFRYFVTLRYVAWETVTDSLKGHTAFVIRAKQFYRTLKKNWTFCNAKSWSNLRWFLTF
jgi:hypothetical protein